MDDDPIAGDEESTASVVEELANELEAGTVPDAEIERLRAALFDDESGALEARVEKLQRDVDELLAYAGALEAFLDEHGSGEQLIETVRDDVDEVHGAVDDLEAELDRVDEKVASLQEWRTQLVSVLSEPDGGDGGDGGDGHHEDDVADGDGERDQDGRDL